MTLADDHGLTFGGESWPERYTREQKLVHLQRAAAREQSMVDHCDPENLNYYSRRAAMFKRRVELMEAGSS